MVEGRNSTDDPMRGRLSGRAKPSSRLVFGDLALQILRAKWTVLLVFLSVFLLAFFGTNYLQPISLASATLKVDASSAAQMAAALSRETDRLRDPSIAEQTISRFQPDILYPEFAASVPTGTEYDGGQQNAQVFRRLVARLQADLNIEPDTASGTLRVTYRHADPQVAVDVLHVAIQSYLAAQPGEADRLPDPQAGIPPALSTDPAARRAIEADIATFEAEHAIDDFDSEVMRLEVIDQFIAGEKLTQETRRDAVAERLRAVRTELRRTPKDIVLAAQSAAATPLQVLETERADMLRRYKPDSRAIAAIDQRIDRLREEVPPQPSAAPAGAIKGPNPVYQQLLATRTLLQSEYDAAQFALNDLTQRAEAIAARRRQLTDLQMEWSRLKARLDTLTAQSPATESVSPPQPPARSRAPGVELIAPPVATGRQPATGTRLALASFVLAAALALLAGLWAPGPKKKLISPGRLARRTGLPVLATVGRR